MQVYLAAFSCLLSLCVLAFPVFFSSLQLGFCSPFYVGCSLIEPWDSLSGYVHPGIACLASQASDWAGAFWGSLSGFVVGYLLLGVHPSMTLVKLIMIGYCCDCFDGQLNCLVSTHWLTVMSEHVSES